MSFFKDFKEDFSQAVNELMPGEDVAEKDEDLVVNTLEQEMDAKAELDKLEGLFEKVEAPTQVVENVSVQPAKAVGTAPVQSTQKVQAASVQSTQKVQAVPVKEPAVQKEEPKAEAEVEVKEIKEEVLMNTEEVKETVEEAVNVQPAAPAMPKEVTDEVAIITEGTSLTGNMESTGSIEIRGKVTGDVKCNGKLTVTGIVKGNSSASEFFADSAKIEGEINTEGTVKIGLGSVIVGNITATSAVIAGAIKGDIDVQGPVIVDTSAVVMGNIKSRSVQINNGAVIEGFCSQCYAEVDVNKLFD